MTKNNLNDKIILICKSIVYYSNFDEDIFFQWLKHIESIKKLHGRLDELYLYFDSNQILDDDLRELLALYKIDMTQLKVFLTENNKNWFCSKTAYWFKHVFKQRGKDSS